MTAWGVRRRAPRAYTVVDDGDFLIDRASTGSAVMLVSACSGHGFKHSAAIGEAVAVSIIGSGMSNVPEAFRASRFEPRGPR